MTPSDTEVSARGGEAALLESEIVALMRRLAEARDTAAASSLEMVRSYAEARQSVTVRPVTTGLEQRVRASGLFDPEAYLSLNPDRCDIDDAWQDFLHHGMHEGRAFISQETVARVLVQADAALRAERYSLTRLAEARAAAAGEDDSAAPLRRHATKIAVFCSSLGNFYMREIADLLTWGLQAEGLDAVQRDETAGRDEPFDLRVFVAPHEFFWLEEGKKWREVAGAAGSVLYNVEQPQTPWFCRAFPLLLDAPLVLDINLHTAVILRRAGCKVVHFMPGHLAEAPYTKPFLDISSIPLAKGYAFARRPYNWLEQNRLDERPIDLLFIGARTPRRDEALLRLQALADRHRFWCVYRDPSAPFTAADGVAREYGWALAQRSKIVLSLHRDWIGSFEWPRMVMQGFWQGACVVSDPGLGAPLFAPNVHYLEENSRHIAELVRWLLEAEEGREKLDRTRKAAYQQACSIGSMHIALGPVLEAFAAALQV